MRRIVRLRKKPRFLSREPTDENRAPGTNHHQSHHVLTPMIPPDLTATDAARRMCATVPREGGEQHRLAACIPSLVNLVRGGTTSHHFVTRDAAGRTPATEAQEETSKYGYLEACLRRGAQYLHANRRHTSRRLHGPLLLEGGGEQHCNFPPNVITIRPTFRPWDSCL